jgi:hypothetical protein
MVAVPTPRIEKRIMPLLDVTLSLVGALILMIGIANEEPSSGTEGQIVRLLAERNGDVVFGRRVVATSQHGIHEDQLLRLFDDLAQIDSPLVLLYYPSPEAVDSEVDAQMVAELIRRLVEEGHMVKSMEMNEPRMGDAR